MILYEWPRAAAFGRVIPKNKIYEHASANTALKDLFPPLLAASGAASATARAKGTTDRSN